MKLIKLYFLTSREYYSKEYENFYRLFFLSLVEKFQASLRTDVAAEGLFKWLWYPYIPFGKITVVQGDPGDGKTTVVLAIAAAVTTGSALPERVIFLSR